MEHIEDWQYYNFISGAINLLLPAKTDLHILHKVLMFCGNN